MEYEDRDSISHLDFDPSPLTEMEELKELTSGAASASRMLLKRLDEVTDGCDGMRFDSLPMTNGDTFRVATMRMPIQGPHFVHRGMMYRVVVNQGSTQFIESTTQEEHILYDILVQPLKFLFDVRLDRYKCKIGYGELAPPNNMPPRIARNPSSGRYMLLASDAYDMPELPTSAQRYDPTQRLKLYLNLAHTTLRALQPLSETTRIIQ